jgi:hypothetical protein
MLTYPYNTDSNNFTRGKGMKDLKSLLEEKILRLEQLIKARPKAYCSTIHSSEEDVKRESEIDDLETEIKEIEAQINP